VKIQGRTHERYRGIVQFIREVDGELSAIQIRVQQLPATWDSEAARMLPEPLAKPNGWKMEDGERVPKYDTEDPAYKKAHETWTQRMQAKKIHDSCVDDGVEFEADEALLHEDPPAYYDAIFAELCQTFSRGELNQWLLTVNAIGQVGGSDIALQEQAMFQRVAASLRISNVAEDEGSGAE
jgi:hypothetical protein